MKRALLLLLATAALSSGLWAQQPPAKIAQVATTWRGVNYGIYRVERIAGDRLLIGVELIPTLGAPPEGVFIAVHGPPPPKVPNPSSGLIVVAKRDTGPLSLDTAVLTDDLTKQTYEVVPPDPAGPNYLPSQTYGVLRANEVDQMAIQFPCPPPPPSGQQAKQTVSLLLPNAKGPITGIEIPPPAPVQAQ
jgi:hypothetical protein